MEACRKTLLSQQVQALIKQTVLTSCLLFTCGCVVERLHEYDYIPYPLGKSATGMGVRGYMAVCATYRLGGNGW